VATEVNVCVLYDQQNKQLHENTEVIFEHTKIDYTLFIKIHVDINAINNKILLNCNKVFIIVIKNCSTY